MIIDNPKFSIIVNCRNCEEFLVKTLSSVLNQTYSNWELIFWDNCSIDRSKVILESFSDKRLKYFSAKIPLELGEARNKAIEVAKGEFIAFLDADDWWEPFRLEVLSHNLNDSNIGVLYTNGWIYFEKTGNKKKFYFFKQRSGDLFYSLIARYNIYLPTVVFRRKALDSLQYYFNKDFSMIEEADLIIRLAKNWKIGYVHNKLSYWRAHENSLTWTKNENFFNENTILINQLLENYPDLKNHNSIKKFKARNSYRNYITSLKLGNIKREVLRPYIFIDFRIAFFYFLSFFSPKLTIKLLIFLGKELK